LEREAKEAADRKFQDEQNRRYMEEYYMDTDFDEDHVEFAPPTTEIQQDLVEPYQNFISALSECPMILGFHAAPTHTNADKCCYCPCGSKLKPWRDSHGIKLSQCSTARFTANGLMDHLNQKGNPKDRLQTPCLYHWMTLTYLQIMYGDFWGPGIGHKALHKPGDPKYKKAEQAEARRRAEELATAQQRIADAETRVTELEKEYSVRDLSVILICVDYHPQ
jgi:hypothetical protein